jgi:hypothetical protein
MSLALTLALTLVPLATPRAGDVGGAAPPRLRRASGPNLVARCLWGEQGWRAVVLGLELDDPDARRFALHDLREHQRLHGWVGDLGDGLSWMISVPASCPPAALFELSEGELAPASGELYGIYRLLARVFAEAGHVERALPFLEAIRAGVPPVSPAPPVSSGPAADGSADPCDGVELAAARVLQRAGEWERALDVLDRPRERSAVPHRAEDLARMTSLLELGRVEELERLVVRGLGNGDECRPLELLIEGWRRAGVSLGIDHLIGAAEARLGRPLGEEDRARLDALWDIAVGHRRVLESAPRYAGPELVSLLGGGAHVDDVLERLEAAGTDLVDDLLEHLTALLAAPETGDGGVARALARVLAETGDARALPVLEGLEGLEGPAEPGGLDGPVVALPQSLLERWRAANALRRDLAEEQPR